MSLASFLRFLGSDKQTAQDGVHALIGYGTVLTFMVFRHFYLGSITAICFAISKELLDIYGPEQAGLSSSLRDVGFYALGVVASGGTYAIGRLTHQF